MTNTKAHWCTHTFNAWIGCTKVAPECVNCYAADRNGRRNGGMNWGPGSPREKTSSDYWKLPIEWNDRALKSGEPARVFCASWSDVFDQEVDHTGWRDELWKHIRQTPNLIWLIPTKRPERISDCLPQDWDNGYENVWLGTSVGHEESLWRL